MWRRKVDRTWRFFVTLLSFFLFGLGGLVIGFVIFPLVFVFVRDSGRRQRIARRLVRNAFRLFLAIMQGLGALSYEVHGMEHASVGRNQLIIANHPSLIDVIFLVALFPMVDCVIKEAITRNPFMRSVVLSTNWIPSGNTGVLMNTCVSRLQAGSRLLLFPEGTRSIPGRPLDFKLGAASFAIKAGAGILPVTIQCTQPRLLAKGEPWYRIPPERPLFTIRVFPPRSVDDFIPSGLHPRDATRELNRAFLAFFESELGRGPAR